MLLLVCVIVRQLRSKVSDVGHELPPRHNPSRNPDRKLGRTFAAHNSFPISVTGRSNVLRFNSDCDDIVIAGRSRLYTGGLRLLIHTLDDLIYEIEDLT